MVEVVRAHERHFADFGWLQTYWLFSFGSYFDPRNVQFGALRVFNDDVVAPGRGFPTHPHEEMEIITLVLDGELTHEDSMGHQGVIHPGDVQRMSAGTGITHSELNLADQPVHLYQIWILPDQSGLEPSYDQRSFQPEDWQSRLLPVASGQGLEGAVTFHTDATIYRCALDAGQQVGHDVMPNRKVFLYLTRGQLSAEGTLLETEDQARIQSDRPLVLEAQQDAHFILIDVPATD